MKRLEVKFFKSKEKRIYEDIQLNYYINRINEFRNIYHIRSVLNSVQIEKLDGFLDRAILFCNNKKYVKYPKVQYIYDEKLVANSEQLQQYKRLHKYINKLRKDVTSDEHLSRKCQKQLVYYLSSVQSHLIGKCNSKYKK